MDVNKSLFDHVTPLIAQNQQGNCYNYKKWVELLYGCHLLSTV